MTEYRRYRRPLPSTKAVTLKIITVAVAAALAIGGLISLEMASGNDPALGQKATRVKHASTTSTGSSGSSPGYSYYGYGSDGDSPDSSGSGAGSSAYSYSPPPVTSTTS